jgi:RHS repeat-associated protein
LTNTYSTDHNNGNILGQTLKTVPGTTVHERYSYDGANRLTVAGEYTATPPVTPACTDSGLRWCQGFAYDGPGNRRQTAAIGMTQSLLSPSSIDAETNRIPTDAGDWAYDITGHGNVTKDPSNRTYAYDSENRLVAVCTSDPGGCANSVGPGRTLYEYDADGRRVRKTDANGSATVYVYDAMGQLAAEYGGTQVAGRSYLTADQLGSTRVISGANQTITACMDYTPFGETVMPVSNDFRNSGCYVANAGVKQEFTGKERDGESGLDYFGARYFSGGQGRFTSPDALIMKKDWLRDPQRWNHYAYVRNNPLRYIDPNGEDLEIYIYYGRDLTEEQKKYLQANIKHVQAAIAGKFKKAGVEKVEFRDGRKLTDKQVAAIRANNPAGVATLNFVNQSFADNFLGNAKGATDPPVSVVSLQNTFAGSLINPTATDDATKTFRLGEVASHERGHALGFESNTYVNYITAGASDFFRSNLMDENQGVPTRAKFFDTGSDKNKRIIDEVNRVGDNTPSR